MDFTLPPSLDEGLRRMCCDVSCRTVDALAEKYGGFDAEEAKAFLAFDKVTVKLKRSQSSLLQDEDQPKGPTSKKSKSSKYKNSTVNKSPRKPHGFMLYSNHVRADVKAALVAELGAGHTKSTDVFRQIGVRWKELGEEEKNSWIAKAKATPPPQPPVQTEGDEE